MPSWSGLPKQQRWQIVTFLQSNAKTEVSCCDRAEIRYN